MQPTEYSIHIASIDAYAAFTNEAKQAEREGMTNLAKRQAATALHITNAAHHMSKLCPEGYRVDTTITYRLVPNVNPILADEYRR